MENNRLITILTPTYNRAHLLNKLYMSLLNQTNYNFEWLIIDDGSKDNTKDVVKTFKNEKFIVKYIFKENGGKHRALNFGIDNIETPLVFIVDSDDWLTNDAIESIEDYYNKYQDSEKIAGFSFLRKYPDGKINVSTGRLEPFIDSYFNIRVKENRIGDMAEVYFTEILKNNHFPEIDGEKFIGEDIVWLEISKKYNLVFIEKSIYISEYLEEGLTKRRKELNINNPIGCYYRSLKFLEFKNLNLKWKLKSLLQLIVYGKFAGYKFNIIIKNEFKIQICLLYVFGLIIYYKWSLDRNGKI